MASFHSVFLSLSTASYSPSLCAVIHAGESHCMVRRLHSLAPEYPPPARLPHPLHAGSSWEHAAPSQVFKHDADSGKAISCASVKSLPTPTKAAACSPSTRAILNASGLRGWDPFLSMAQPVSRRQTSTGPWRKELVEQAAEASPSETYTCLDITP